MNIEVSNKLLMRVRAYCAENGENETEFIERIIFEGLNREMYGDNPFDNIRRENEYTKTTPPDTVLMADTVETPKNDVLKEEAGTKNEKKNKKVRIIKTIK